jgi:hypothetical protein
MNIFDCSQIYRSKWTICLATSGSLRDKLVCKQILYDILHRLRGRFAWKLEHLAPKTPEYKMRSPVTGRQVRMQYKHSSLILKFNCKTKTSYPTNVQNRTKRAMSFFIDPRLENWYVINGEGRIEVCSYGLQNITQLLKRPNVLSS